MARSGPTLVQNIAAAMVAAGLFTQEQINATRRIVIDLKASDIPVMYVEMLADEALLEVVTSLEGIQIKGVNREPVPDTAESSGGEQQFEEQDQEDAGHGR